VSSSEEFDSADLFPDYLAECEEHLTSAGLLLLGLESAPERVEREQIDGLFRDFHTIKGLSGMVGLSEAERLSHQLEGYLGAIRKGHANLSAKGVGLLLEGIKTLERVIAARGARLPVPDVDLLVEQVISLVPDYPHNLHPASSVQEPTPSPTAAPPNPFARADAALRAGAQVWRVRFTPSRALTERGLNVNAIRERLRAAGEIVLAEPTAVPGGISFTFLVIGKSADFEAAIQGEGVTVEPYATASLRVADGNSAPRRVASLSPINLVRVDLGRLDELMRTVGELVITRARLENGLAHAASTLPAAEWRALQETSLAIERQLRDLREGVMRLRLVPVRDVFARMRFVVRDLSHETGREIDLHLTGEETEVDKFVVERLADPLLHLIRNAVSHGLEPVAERVAGGKPARGRIDLRAAAAGGAIVIEVEDDGRGIDPEKVYARARKAGLVATDTPTDPAGVLDLICSPGFSTHESTDRASGRGVGMDVVARSVEDLGGTLTLFTCLGRGTRFTARLPLTLAIADALIVIVGGQTYAVPQTAVREVLEIEPGATTTLENNELLTHRDGVLPLLRLTDLFGAPRPVGTFTALVVGEGSGTIALATDRIIGLREIVVRPLADPLVQVPGIAGATELGDGRAILILDTTGLARCARARHRPTA
jgi:two-component system, chemotaxis family, sensor kinase CheA